MSSFGLCSICKTNFSISNMAFLRTCKHTFCCGCITNRLRRDLGSKSTPFCPNCGTACTLADIVQWRQGMDMSSLFMAEPEAKPSNFNPNGTQADVLHRVMAMCRENHVQPDKIKELIQMCVGESSPNDTNPRAQIIPVQERDSIGYCNICLFNFSVNDIAFLRTCKHTFCCGCIKNHLRCSQFCPNCRTACTLADIVEWRQGMDISSLFIVEPETEYFDSNSTQSVLLHRISEIFCEVNDVQEPETIWTKFWRNFENAFRL